MANPLNFKPRKVDPRLELRARLDAAPIEHAEALLVAYDLLGEAHQKGVLDLLLGVVGSKNEIFAKIAQYAKEPISTQAMRNGIVLLRLLGSIDPEVLLKTVEAVAPPVEVMELPKTLAQADQQAAYYDRPLPSGGKEASAKDGKGGKPKDEEKTPSLFALGKRLFSEDSRRGLDVATRLLAGFGKAVRK